MVGLTERVVKLLTNTERGRAVTIWLHPRLHPRIEHPMRFANDQSCLLCKLIWRDVERRLPRFDDRSHIKISEPGDGKFGIAMTATAKRQFDDIMANAPEEEREALRRAIEEIARNPNA